MPYNFSLIPYRMMMDRGYDRNVIVLTQPEGYRKQPASRMLAGARRSMSSCRPSGWMAMGRVPVVLHRTRCPPAVRPAAIMRVTVDLPRVPFT